MSSKISRVPISSLTGNVTHLILGQSVRCRKSVTGRETFQVEKKNKIVAVTIYFVSNLVNHLVNLRAPASPHPTDLITATPPASHHAPPLHLLGRCDSFQGARKSNPSSTYRLYGSASTRSMFRGGSKQ